MTKLYPYQQEMLESMQGRVGSSVPVLHNITDHLQISGRAKRLPSCGGLYYVDEIKGFVSMNEWLKRLRIGRLQSGTVLKFDKSRKVFVRVPNIPKGKTKFEQAKGAV